MQIGKNLSVHYFDQITVSAVCFQNEKYTNNKNIPKTTASQNKQQNKKCNNIFFLLKWPVRVSRNFISIVRSARGVQLARRTRDLTHRLEDVFNIIS